MGLESHVDAALREAGVKQANLYYWSYGLRIEQPTSIGKKFTAKRIMKILDESRQFGPTRYNEKTNKIEFGVFGSFFPGGDSAKYDQYCKDFKNWLVDSEGEKIHEMQFSKDELSMILNWAEKADEGLKDLGETRLVIKLKEELDR